MLFYECVRSNHSEPQKPNRGVQLESPSRFGESNSLISGSGLLSGRKRPRKSMLSPSRRWRSGRRSWYFEAGVNLYERWPMPISKLMTLPGAGLLAPILVLLAISVASPGALAGEWLRDQKTGCAIRRPVARSGSPSRWPTSGSAGAANARAARRPARALPSGP